MLKYEEPVFRPPGEADSTIVQATIGCSHNKCSFCAMYRNKSFRVRPVKEVLKELSSQNDRFKSDVIKVFIGDADALAAGSEYLIELINGMKEIFPRIRTFSAYAGPDQLFRMDVSDLQALASSGLRRLYVGLESGDDLILQEMNKAVDSSQMAIGFARAVEAGFQVFATAILGLGGRERSLEHARATAEIVRSSRIQRLGLLTLMKPPWELNITELCLKDILDEMIAVVEHLEGWKGVLVSDHGSNPFPIIAKFPSERESLLKDLGKLKEHMGSMPLGETGIRHSGETVIIG